MCLDVDDWNKLRVFMQEVWGRLDSDWAVGS